MVGALRSVVSFCLSPSMATPMHAEALVRAWQLWANWWSQPLLSNPLPSPLLLQPAVQVASAAFRGAAPAWVKPVTVAVGAASARIAQHVYSAGVVAAPVVPAVSPPVLRAVWFVLTTVLSLAGPPAVKAWQKAKSRRRAVADGGNRTELPDSLNASSLHAADDLTLERVVALLLCCLALLLAGWGLRRHRALAARAREAAALKGASASATPSTDAASRRGRPVEESTPRRLAFGDIADQAERAFRAFMLPHLRRAFNSWMGQLRLFRLLRRAACRILLRNLARGWQSFVETTAELRATRAAMHRALRIFIHQQMHKCWRTWAAAAQEGAEERLKQRAAVSEWLESRRRACWSAWCELIARRRMLKLFDEDRIGRSWTTWAVLAKYSPQDRARMTFAVRILTNRLLARGYASWAASWKLSTRKRRSMLSAAIEWLGRRQRAAWVTWVEMAINRRLMVAAARHFCALPLVRAYNSWTSYADQARASRRLLSGALHSLRTMSERRALNSWKFTSTRLLALQGQFASCALTLRPLERPLVHSLVRPLTPSLRSCM